MDQSVNAEDALKWPAIYGVGRRREKYSTMRFWVYIIEAVYAAAVSFYIFYAAQSDEVVGTVFATALATAAIVVASLYVGMNTFSWNWTMHLAVWGSIVVVIVYPLLFLRSTESELYGIATVIYSNIGFWVTMILAIGGALVPRAATQFLRQWLRPSDIRIIQESAKVEKQQQGQRQGEISSNHVTAP